MSRGSVKPFAEEAAFTDEDGVPAVAELVSSLNVRVTQADLAPDISKIGYPQAR